MYTLTQRTRSHFSNFKIIKQEKNNKKLFKEFIKRIEFCGKNEEKNKLTRIMIFLK